MHSSNSIFLIGPMGAGKTTVGRRAARTLGLRFVDMDVELEARCGVNVSTIFDIEGEGGFRAREARLLDELTRERDLMVATGGGVILRDDNRARLKERVLVVYLKTTVERQLERLARDTQRPLLRAPDREARLQEFARVRNPLYEDTADIALTSDSRRPARMAERIVTAVREYRSEISFTVPSSASFA
jgi:shikimate kinase